MRWTDLEAQQPRLAALGRDKLGAPGAVLVGTIRKDGTPRISNVEPYILEGGLYLPMMWRSRKAVDLGRDARAVLRNAICTSTGDETEVVVRGRAVEVTDEGERARFVAAAGFDWGGRLFRLFALEVESVAVVSYGDGRQRVLLWPQGVERDRPYP